MRKILAAGLGVTLGYLTGSAHAQEVVWRPVARTVPTPLVAIAAEPLPDAPPPLPAPSAGLTSLRLSRWLVRPPVPSVFAGEGRVDFGEVVGSTGPIVRAQMGVESLSAPTKLPAPEAIPAPRPLESPPPLPDHIPTALPHHETIPTGYASPPVHGGFVQSEPITIAPDYTWPHLLPNFGSNVAASVPHGYLRGEYLLWWVKDQNVPPLLTTSPPASNGILGQPGTTVLYGGHDPNPGGVRDGARFTGAFWLDECLNCGIDGSFFFLGRRGYDDVISSPGTVLARPIVAVNSLPPLNLPGEFAELIASPGIAQGAAEISGSSYLWGADINARWNLCCVCGLRADLLGGFRYLDLQEDMQIREYIREGPNALDPDGTLVVVTDRFATHNRFYGGQIGTEVQYQRGRFFVDAIAKVALGDTHQTLQIDGSQLVQRPGQPPAAFVGGLLATSSNIGRFERDSFTVVPEITLNVGVQATDHLRFFAGYNFLYWSSVLRPGEQIDRSVDLTLVPNSRVPVAPSGLNRPAVLFHENDFWAQGIQFGCEFRW